jgi:polyphosphate glucokinase
VSSAALAIDVGATSIKSAVFNRDGAMVGKRSRRSTPYPCWPERLVEVLARLIERGGVPRVGLGFPGEVDQGVVIDAANLVRQRGAGTPVVPEIDASWRGFDLRSALQSATGCETTVLNDAAMAALGCSLGEGVEMTITLGTGCGLAVVREGDLVPVRDLGNETFDGSATFDEVIGERGRAVNENRWSQLVVEAVSDLAGEFEADVIHLAGGNARRLAVSTFGDLASKVRIERDDPALLGAWRAAAD